MRSGIVLVAVVLGWAAPALAQEPAAAPPAAGEGSHSGAPEIELLPEIGRIGAQVGISAAASWNPYEVGRGLAFGGYVDLPLARSRAGRLSYEILLNLSDGESDPFVVTSPVAYVANLAAGADPDAALAGPPAAPFPVRRLVRTRLKVLQISPFGLRHALTGLDGARLRPYVAGGLDFAVVISRQDPVAAESLTFTGTSPFDAALIGGLIAQSPELAERGLPTGQGNLEWGFHAGAGVEVRVARGVSVNVDYRYAGIGGTAQDLQTAGVSLGLHW